PASTSTTPARTASPRPATIDIVGYCPPPESSRPTTATATTAPPATTSTPPSKRRAQPLVATTPAMAASASTATGSKADVCAAPVSVCSVLPPNGRSRCWASQVSFDEPHRATAASNNATTISHNARLAVAPTAGSSLIHGPTRRYRRHRPGCRDRGQHGPRLVQSFVVLVLGVRVGNDTATGLHMRDTVPKQGRTNRDR